MIKNKDLVINRNLAIAVCTACTLVGIYLCLAFVTMNNRSNWIEDRLCSGKEIFLDCKVAIDEKIAVKVIDNDD
jgi:hypothetical protein